MHLNSLLLFRRYILPLISEGQTVLEIGPDLVPSSYQKEVQTTVTSWDTLDLIGSAHSSKLTYCTTQEYAFPVPDNRYDLILSGQVIEHVRKFWLWLAEINRILRPGGTLALICPVSWPYHQAPIDCWRIYAEGMKVALEEHNLEIVTIFTGCLEVENNSSLSHSPVCPGVSIDTYHPRTLSRILRWNSILSLLRPLAALRVPICVAHDTVAIARKGGA